MRMALSLSVPVLMVFAIAACSPQADHQGPAGSGSMQARTGEARARAVLDDAPGDDPADAADYDPAGPEDAAEPLDPDSAEDTALDTSAPTDAAPVGHSEIETLAESLTPRQKALQLLVVSSWGPAPMPRIAEALGSGCVGGVFVSKGFEHWEPHGSSAAAADAIAAIPAAGSDCAAPPFVATDAEPGTATLKVPVDPLPPPASLAGDYLADPSSVEGLAGRAAEFAAELAALGVHVNFGVVADVNAGSGYYMASKGRSFGGDPEAVAALSAALVDGHCRSGVAAALKHFPNQGSTVEDPHLADSFSANDPDGWAQLGRIPYADATAPLVMTGHVRYFEVDDAAPASLSAEITSGWLRDGLGYEGVIVSDDLYSMSGAGSGLTVHERGMAAIDAGNDMAMFLEVSELGGLADELAEGFAGEGPAAKRLEASLRRVLTLKAALGLLDGIDPGHFELC